VTEDEPLVRMMAVEELVEAGFDVVQAENAQVAVDILESKAAEVEILFTDIQMPGNMDGIGLAKHVSIHWPWIKVVVTSGLGPKDLGDLPAGSHFMPKPYEPEKMVERLQQIMGSG
jgi:CheY-like chemotaxis protein